jgi:hypothetical protein
VTSLLISSPSCRQVQNFGFCLCIWHSYIVMAENCTSGALSRVQLRGRIGLGLGLAASLLSGCDPIAIGSVPPAETPEYRLTVDCAADPAARAQKEILVASSVQILNLFVVGPGFRQESRVQIFHDSDVNISGPNGTAPKHSVPSSELDKGQPVSANLQHGSLTVLRSAHPTIPADPASATPTATASESQSPQEWLTFTLSCAAAPNVTPTPAPQPSY